MAHFKLLSKNSSKRAEKDFERHHCQLLKRIIFVKKLGAKSYKFICFDAFAY